MLCEFSLLTSDAYVNDEWYSHIFNFNLNLAAEWMDKLNEEEKELANRTFDAALEFLSLVDGDCDRGATVAAKRDLAPRRDASKHQQAPSVFATKRRATCKQVMKEQAVTASRKRKLERIKAPVVVFRKTKTSKGASEEEQDKSVKKTLAYLVQLPQQEIYKPPPAPVVTVNIDTEQSSSGTVADSHHRGSGACDPVGVQEYEYLTSEKDIALWKLITSSPTNLNVFVGNLSHQVSDAVLAATFQEFCDQNVKDDIHVKVRVVMDASKLQSKGYGFVCFPVRRAAEMALICMQEFELYGRVMQLGWGQEENKVSALSIPASSSSPLSLAPSVSCTVGPIKPSSTTVSPKRLLSASVSPIQRSLPTVSLIQLSSARVDLIQPPNICTTSSTSADSHVARPTPNMAALAKVRKIVSALPALCVTSSQAFATNGNERLEELIAKKLKTGHKLSDTVYQGQLKISKSEAVPKKKSRWDQETRRAARFDFSADNRAVGDNHWTLDNKVTAVDITGELELRVTRTETKEDIPKLEVIPEDSLSLSNENESTNFGVFCPVEVPCDVDRKGESQDKKGTAAYPKEHAMAVDDNAESDAERKVEVSLVATAGKPSNKDRVENTSATCQFSSAISSEDPVASESKARKAQDVRVAKKLQWVTMKQKVELLKLVCTRLRAIGVTGHVGVFGLHYDADNSRLYVVCAKHVTEAELLEHFVQFGAAEVKLNRDPMGASKGCAFVHYVNPSDATTALKSSHGQVLGGLPLKVMVAEPKSRTGSKKKTRNT